MKKLIVLLFSSLLVLGACGQKEESSSKDDNTKETKKEVKKDEPKKKETETKEKVKKEKKNKESVTKDEPSTKEQPTEEVQSTKENKQIDISNITDRSILEQVIYGNYSEEEKIKAYNSAVANGIIPQGNVVEGPASAAYESSLKVERGEVDSIYKNNQDESTNNNGITIHEDGRQTYKDELGHDKNILTPEDEARQAEENDITPEERAEVEASLAE
ncbi:hypothetical protein [Mammaliicoccus sciuri]|uniref:hypothetical protein n=1 Tax=Mammaliicoccus sciuri TaxID=1296 RepID=UPI001AAE4045|nr:hypothetical protein [Mammaliicoccus sciuri]MBO3080326.1 hypothetical protein [Mammaliicoccus sciuri]